MACFSAMFHATTASTPASAASGMYLANGAATSMNANRNTECRMPEIGPCAPARTFVTVRAMVPVTVIPPNRPEATLATPWATSSQLERWRRPVMLSATTADSSDSIAPNSANASASGSIVTRKSSETCGSDGSGKVRGMPPNLEPIVSTGNCSSTAAPDANTTAISMPGQWGRHRRTAAITAMLKADSAMAAKLAVGNAAPSTSSFGSSSPGSLPASVRPSRSWIWLARMVTAIPAVNPTVTG